MNAAATLRRARRRAGLTLRALAQRAGTSHSTLAAYEAGRKVPTVDTLQRILRAAGFEPQIQLAPGLDGPAGRDRGHELLDALELAALFPARHEPTLVAPRFGPAEAAR